MNFLHKRKTQVLAVALAFIFTAGCAEKKNSDQAKKPAGDISKKDLLRIKQEVYAFRVEGFNKDKKAKWGLEGESASLIGNKIKIKDLKAVYYDEGMTFNITADRAIYDKDTQDIELEENIVGKTSDGGKLFTDYAKWNAKTEMITTDSFVVVKRENMVCTGKGLITKPRLKWVSFKRKVEVSFGEDKRITCDGPFELDKENNVAIFNKNVRITDKDSETLADKLTVYLTPDSNKVTRVVTEGNVKVVHRGGKMDNFANMDGLSI